MSAPAVEDRSKRRRAAAPSPGNRLPAPVKERRPALAALAVLLVVGGALASGLVALRSGHRSDYVVFTRKVEAGDPIRATDLGVTRLAGDNRTDGIAASLRGRLVGQYATTRVYGKTLANPAMFSAVPTVPKDTAVVGAVLAPAQRPADPPRRGDVVAVYDIPKAGSGGSPDRLVAAAQITAVGEASGTDGLPVSLRIPSDRAGDVATAAAQSELTIVELPPGTPLTTTGPASDTSGGAGAVASDSGSSSGTSTSGGSTGTGPPGPG